MKAWLCRLLKVPPEPALPPGSRESVQVFRAARNYYRLLLLQWGATQVSAVIGIVVSLAFLQGISAGWSEEARFWAKTLEYVGIVAYVVQVPFTLLKVRLDFEMRWYIVTDRSLRIRTGVVHVQEMTLTFMNIQHLTVHQGPLQRLLGLYDLRVRTAGGGAEEESSGQPGSNSSLTHVGHFQGVDNAPAIRDLILERMKKAHDAGLGDSDDIDETEVSETSVGMEEFRGAVAAVRAEATKLREALT
jgi:membrane protein YdbS with pleckstrin-like domain